MTQKSTPSLQNRIGHSLAGTMKDNFVLTLIGVLSARLVVIHYWPTLSYWRAWLVATLPIVLLSYAWLAVEHPDR